jgi:N-acetylglucosamine-6-phosphate deacetylase
LTNALALQGGTIFTPVRRLDRGVVVMLDGRIHAVGPLDGTTIPEGAAVEDCAGLLIVPGFVDIHVHGGGGGDATQGRIEGLEIMSAAHARGGTTSLLATTLSAPEGQILAALEAIRAARRMSLPGASVLGAHLEGPFISPGQAGAQDPHAIRPPHSEEIDRLLEYADVIRLVTAAPEVPGGLDLARRLVQRGIVASIGHSDAYYPDIVRAVEAGYRHVTHLYCGMSRWINVKGEKVAGVAEAALLLDDLTVEIIADGNHVSPHMIALTLKAKGPERICLVTDAIPYAGMPPGRYRLGGVDIVTTPTAARMLDDSGNAGSVATMDRVVRFMVHEVGVPLQKVLVMATMVPPRVIGEDHRKGMLSPGMDGDVTVLTEDLHVRMTVVGGHVVYRADPRGTPGTGSW